jgi:hypothetical protein
MFYSIFYSSLTTAAPGLMYAEPVWSPSQNDGKPGALHGAGDRRADTLAKASTLNPSIFDALTSVDGPAAGVGAQLANDLLYHLGFHPFCPAFTICNSDKLLTPYKMTCLSS